MKAQKRPSQCPCCEARTLHVHALGCATCGVRLEGSFSEESNQDEPLAKLTGAELAFAQEFLLAEGRLDDVGDALELSFTIAKARLAGIKQKLSDDGTTPAARPTRPVVVQDTLRPVRPTDAHTENPRRQPVAPLARLPSTNFKIAGSTARPHAKAAPAPVTPAPVPQAAVPEAEPPPVAPEPEPVVAETAAAPIDNVPSDILDALDSGRISYEDALDRLSKLST